MFTVLLLFSLLLTTSTSHNIISYPHFQQLNVKQILTETKLNPTNTYKHLQHQKLNIATEASSSAKYKLKLVHRDKVPTFNTSHDHRTRFNARMQRDTKRVAALRRRLAAGKPIYAEEAFGSDVVSGMEQGSGEYFVRIGVGSPPRNQYVVIDSGSDIIWVHGKPLITI